MLCNCSHFSWETFSNGDHCGGLASAGVTRGSSVASGETGVSGEAAGRFGEIRAEGGRIFSRETDFPERITAERATSGGTRAVLVSRNAVRRTALAAREIARAK